jgi:hypothetical protein
MVVEDRMAEPDGPVASLRRAGSTDGSPGALPPG